MNDPLRNDLVTRAEAQSYVDDAVRKQQEKYRDLFEEFTQVCNERDKYMKALEELCTHGRCPTAEKALGLESAEIADRNCSRPGWDGGL